MSNILITELENQGPGDILGAIGGETEVDPAIIGNIEIKNSKALVEVGNGSAQKLAAQLNGKKVGYARVSACRVTADNFDELNTILNYIENFLQLVELERKQEMREHERSIKMLSGEQRQEEGKAILQLKGRDEGMALEGKLVKFLRQNQGEPLPDTQIKVGDLVMLSKKDPLRGDNMTGTVTQKTNYSITVAFDNPRSFLFDQDLRMDLYVNDITYQRMKDALGRLRSAEGSQADLRNIIVGLQPPETAENFEIQEWFNTELNESQEKAVRQSLGAKHIHLVHGPPGTGKTTTAIEVIEQAVSTGHKVLATAASNTAVDNILEFLIEAGIKAVRVGHPARVTSALKEHTLDSLIADNDNFLESEELRGKAFAKKDEQDQHIYPSGKYRRGMSNSKIKELAKNGESSRGVSEDKIKDMAQWIDLQEEIQVMFRKADELRQKAIEEVLSDKQVICATNSTAGSELIKGQKFDLVVIDEATQATEPSCLIPLMHGDKAVLAGDHKQLPPTVKNLKAERKGLRDTLFERLAQLYPESKTMLEKQYRMHEKIMGFSSYEFYENRVQADDQVNDHTLNDLELEVEAFDEGAVEILAPDQPLVMVDTSEIDARERSRKGSTSKENPKEAELAAQLVDSLLSAGLQANDIAVISPYDDQVELINQEIGIEDIEVKTVDGFQGREKEVVIISLTRSNSKNALGFLEDIRRLNVSLTRAKRKLIVIGDVSTISSNPTYNRFFNYVEENGDLIKI